MNKPKSDSQKNIEGLKNSSKKSRSQVVIDKDFLDPLVEDEARNKWSNIKWREVEVYVFKLQKRIYQASSRGDVKLVRKLQRLLLKSYYAKLLAVRRVTQDNQGKKTAGVDGVKNVPPSQRFKLVENLKLGSKPKPTRRIYIPKPGTDASATLGVSPRLRCQKKRPLGIPTMYDRALQALVKQALEPEWEAKFEPNSYGFRPGRSCRDAAEAIFLAIRTKSKYVLDADISKCFDRINHGKLLEKLNTYPTLRRQIRAWLKAGFMDKFDWFPTSEGTPQGGVISPLLANIALHGMENCIKNFLETVKMYTPKGNRINRGDKRNSISLIRYADDFVILHEDLTIVQRCKEIISEWLLDIGLELKPSKTRLAHTLNEYEGEKAGFDFLGWTIRQFKTGKYRSGKNTHKEVLGFATIIKPS
jgi:RNA-directed DNA polymerase